MAVVIAAAMHKLVVYRGTNFEQWGWLLNYGLIAVAWWCAHKLTWDCTLMDEKQDASGQGLLQTAGLDATGGAVHEGDSAHLRSAVEASVGPAAKPDAVAGRGGVLSGLCH